MIQLKTIKSLIRITVLSAVLASFWIQLSVGAASSGSRLGPSRPAAHTTLAQQPQRSAQTIDQRGGAAGEMKGAAIGNWRIGEVLFDIPNFLYDFAGVLGETEGLRGGDDAAAALYE